MTFDILSRDLNVFAPYFLEASAGTGKTFAIEHFVTRLIIEGKSPLSIGQILVVTFTRAATRELKKRIRTNLQRAREELLSSSPKADYLKAVCERGEVKEAIRRIDAALIDYDQAQIFTLHGFCHRVLNEFAFEAGAGLEFSDPDAKEHLPLLHQMVKSHLKEEVALPDYSPYQIKTVMKGDHRKMVSKLVGMVNGNKKMSSGPSFGALHEAFLKAIAQLPSIDAAQFKADIEALRPCYKKMEIDPRHIDLLASILASKQCTLQQFDALLHGDFLLEKMAPEFLKVRAKLPQSLHYPGLIEQLRRSLLPLMSKASDTSSILLRLAHDMKKKSESVLERAQKFSPDDLLSKVELATHSPRFVQRVREKYRAAIVDEFQDTDPIQWKIFQTLFLGHMQAVCLVGDPKQAIYAFRNADVYTYLDAADAMGSSVRRHLDTNYRASPSLTAALNHLFARAQGSWMSLPLRGAQLQVLPVKAGTLPHPNDPSVPIKFFVADAKKFEQNAYPYIATEIIALHQQGVELHGIAILVKDRYQGKEIVDYLKECCIPVSFMRSGSIVESPAYSAFKEVLKAVCSPHDLSKVKAALCGPLIGWEVEKILDGSALLESKAQMQSLKTILIEKGFGVFFQNFLQTLWNGSFYPDLRKLCELILEESLVRSLQGSKIIDFLTEVSIEADADETRLKNPFQEEKGSVVAMTMHQSKGLEFDTVFALGAIARQTLSDTQAIRKGNEQWMTVYDPEDPSCRQALEEQDAEKLRGLYVALTRAKRRLYIPLSLDEKPPAPGTSSPIELFFAQLQEENPRAVFDSLGPLIGYKMLEEIPQPRLVLPDAPTELKAPPVFPAYDQQILSFTALAKSVLVSREIVKPPPNALQSPHTLPLGSETGHLLHLLFEMIFKRGLHMDENAIARFADEELLFTPLQEFRSMIGRWIVELLQKKILDFSLSEIRNVQQEMEFFFPVAQGRMKGFCDLVFEQGGKYYLLDWKSNYLGPTDDDYTEENLVKAMKEHDYFLQASIYTEALKRFVALFDDRPFEECYGGAIYYFIRGKAALHFKQDRHTRWAG